MALFRFQDGSRPPSWKTTAASHVRFPCDSMDFLQHPGFAETE